MCVQVPCVYILHTASAVTVRNTDCPIVIALPWMLCPFALLIQYCTVLVHNVNKRIFKCKIFILGSDLWHMNANPCLHWFHAASQLHLILHSAGTTPPLTNPINFPLDRTPLTPCTFVTNNFHRQAKTILTHWNFSWFNTKNNPIFCLTMKFLLFVLFLTIYFHKK